MNSKMHRSFLRVFCAVALLTTGATFPKGVIEAKLPHDVSSPGVSKTHGHGGRKVSSHGPSGKNSKASSPGDKGEADPVHKHPVFGNRDDASAKLIMGVLEVASRHSVGKP